jgi:hypothetical protein
MSVPIVEVAAVTLVTTGRRPGAGWARLVDAHFAGHAPWTLLLVAIAGSTASFPPPTAWALVTGVLLWSLFGVLAWSAWIDFSFYRCAIGASRGAAWRDVIVQRAIVWARSCDLRVPSFEPRQLADTIGEVLQVEGLDDRPSTFVVGGLLAASMIAGTATDKPSQRRTRRR